MKSGDVGAEGRRKVFDAVGFTFINRLLTTSKLLELITIEHEAIALKTQKNWTASAKQFLEPPCKLQFCCPCCFELELKTLLLINDCNSTLW